MKQLRYLAAALKAPRITEAAQRLAEQARDAGWTHEDYLAAVLEGSLSPQRSRCAAADSRRRVPRPKNVESSEPPRPTGPVRGRDHEARAETPHQRP